MKKFTLMITALVFSLITSNTIAKTRIYCSWTMDIDPSELNSIIAREEAAHPNTEVTNLSISESGDTYRRTNRTFCITIKN